MATASTRTVWKGAISFGLVHIPVALYTATAETRPRFKLIDKSSMSPVGNQQVNKTTGEAVQRDELVKGHRDRGWPVLQKRFKLCKLVLPAIRWDGYLKEREMTEKYEGSAPRAKRGFAAMSPERQRQIASLGGRAAHQSGHAHEFTSAEARIAGKKRHERQPAVPSN